MHGGVPSRKQTGSPLVHSGHSEHTTDHIVLQTRLLLFHCCFTAVPGFWQPCQQSCTSCFTDECLFHAFTGETGCAGLLACRRLPLRESPCIVFHCCSTKTIVMLTDSHFSKQPFPVPQGIMVQLKSVKGEELDADPKDPATGEAWPYPKVRSNKMFKD